TDHGVHAMTGMLHSQSSSARCSSSSSDRCCSSRILAVNSNVHKMRKAAVENHNGTPIDTGSVGTTEVFGCSVLHRFPDQQTNGTLNMPNNPTPGESHAEP